jgi:hypothetical protein
MTDLRLGVSWRRKRTTAWKARARQKFWTEHGEKVRLVVIGAGVVVVASAFAVLAIH